MGRVRGVWRVPLLILRDRVYDRLESGAGQGVEGEQISLAGRNSLSLILFRIASTIWYLLIWFGNDVFLFHWIIMKYYYYEILYREATTLPGSWGAACPSPP